MMSSRLPENQERVDRGYYLLTLGCPKNEVDSDLIVQRLAEAGWNREMDPRAASAIVVNTCSFIAPALEESIEEVLDLSGLKEETGAVLVVAGCMVARYGAKKLAGLLPEVDAFLPCEAHEDLVAVLEGFVQGEAAGRRGIRGSGHGGAGRARVASPRQEISRHGLGRTVSGTLGRGFVYVKIAEGCSRRCAFCAIPSIRGPLRSRGIEDIEEEVRYFAGKGAREVVLIAQDTTQYGLDIYGKPRLRELVERLSNLEGEFRMRVMYMHPEGLSDDILEAMRSPRVCNYLDLPFQHVDARVLRSMGRHGDGKSHLRLLERAREYLGEVAVRATFMVGFPGEEREAYDKMRRFIEEAGFDWLALFGYSHEEGTPAFLMQPTVRKGVIRSRMEELCEIQDEIMREIASEQVGRDFDVLVEGRSMEAPGFWEARSWREAPEIDGVVFIRDSPVLKPGACLRVSIVSTEGIDLHGEVGE